MQGLKGSHVSKTCHDIIPASIKFLNSLDRIQVVLLGSGISAILLWMPEVIIFFSGEEVTLARLFAGIKMTSGTQGSGIPEMFAIPQLISSSLNPKPTV